MKRLFAVLFIFVLLALSAVPSVSAMKKDEAGNGIETEKSTGAIDVEGDYYFFFSNADTNASTIEGKVGGDIIAAGNSLDIKAGAGGNIRAAALELSISSPSAKNITVASGNLTVLPECVSNAFYAFGETVTYKGSCQYAKITATTVYLYGKISANAVIEADNVYISSDCDITKLLIKSANQPKVFTGDNYTNAVPYTENKELAPLITFEKQKDVFVQKTESMLLTLPMQMILVCLICLLFTKPVNNAAEIFRYKRGRIFGFGALGMFGIPFVAVLMVVFVYTMYISAVLLVAYLLIYLVSLSFTSASISRVIMPKINKYLSSLIVVSGAVVVSIIPLAGALINAFSLLYTFGFILSSLFTKKQVAPPVIEVNDIAM